MSEATIQSAIQDALQALAEFNDDDVFIDDWGRLDGPTVNAPYVQILTADDFDQRQDSMDGVKVTWLVRLVLYVRWQDWEDAYPELRDVRQAVIAAFRGDGGALDIANSDLVVTRVRNDGPVSPYFPPYGAPNPDIPLNQQLPTFLTQGLLVTVEEVIC